MLTVCTESAENHIRNPLLRCVACILAPLAHKATPRYVIPSSNDAVGLPTSRRVVLADDHALLRDGLRSLLGTLEFSDVEVVGEAADIAEATRVTRLLKPDLLVLDLKMPGGQSVQLIRELISELPKLRILVLTMYDDPAFLRSVLAAGGHGYLLKRSAYSEFANAIRAVLGGELYVDPSLRSNTALRKDEVQATSPDVLTAREREVFVLLARGLTYAEVGKRLHIGARTVETHRRKILEKLSLETRADLLRYALEFGLLAPGDLDET
jgi:two-component system, NarL family, response regulator NreC